MSRIGSRVLVPAAVALAALSGTGCQKSESAPVQPQAKAAAPAKGAAAAAVEAPAAPAAADVAAATEAALKKGWISAMQEAVAGSAQMAVANEVEQFEAEVRAAVLDPWVAAWRAKTGAFPASVLATAANVPAFAAGWAETRVVDQIREARWSAPAATDARKATEDYLAEFGAIDDLRMDVIRVAAAEGQTRAFDVRFDLRGKTTAGNRRNDRGVLSVVVVKEATGWRVKSIAPSADGGMERVEAAAGRAPSFANSTATAGLDKVKVVDRKEAIRRGGYALAVGDYDDDGRPDLLVGSFGPVQLFRNTEQGYVDVTEQVGLAGATLVKSAAFADMDNDGKRDLLLLRFTDGKEGTDRAPDLLAYRNNGKGSFEHKPEAFAAKRRYDRAMPLTVADFNGDGKLDLYVGFPGIRDFTNNLTKREREAGLQSQGVWLNQGGWAFAEAPDPEGVFARNIYPHAAVATDLNADGRPDVVVVDDSGNVSPVYLNQGNGAFTDATRSLQLDAPGFAMGAAVADYDEDGRLDMVTSSVALTAARRILDSTPASKPGDPIGDQGNFARLSYRGSVVYRAGADGKFADETKKSGLEWVGEAAGAAIWFDYDGDGRQDLYVPNGLWSAGPKKLDSLYMRAMVAKPEIFRDNDDTHRATVFQAAISVNPMLDVLRNEKGADGQLAYSLGGFERNRLFRNNGDGTFTEVGYLEDADRIEDGYIAAITDYDIDGRPDLVLRNCDPAPGLTAEVVTVLRNTRADAQGTRVVLVPTSGRDGIGATVRLTAGNRTLVREVQSVNGATQSEPALFLGARVGQVSEVRVRWTDGTEERFPALKPGKVELVQGKGQPILTAAPAKAAASRAAAAR